ncbi:Lysophospholipase L1 [Natronincola peptidivorans]|uniref:Lysophospholipase L1 n=1 Tax=Natronincola peptidivorans TaxID=426128 RepID=A0A1I0DDF5_9FIRM|nr:SGNH/GDSL hydrolase family protein [Natronincola peptidivorans]SET30338.1 Lysophospholipase L1 [Natronincola peptidivorans]
MKSKLIACFGDSITQGQPGVSYLKYLDKKIYQNHGLGGDTLTGMLNRVKENISKSECNNYILQIGTNDVLLPHLKECSNAWKNKIKVKNKAPIVDLSRYRDEYEKLIEVLHTKHISIISIPCLGENLNSDLNKKVDAYNLVIMNICNNKGIRYINFNSWQKKSIREKENHYFISENPNDVIWDSLLTTYLGLSGWISKKRDLDITVDGVHLNCKGAIGLAKLIMKEKE